MPDLALLCACLDLTSLNSTDTSASIEGLCAKALASQPRVKTVCVFPRFISLCKELLGDSGVGVTTVAGGFPHGLVLPDAALVEISSCLQADEIDIVFPRYLANQERWDELREFLNQCRSACAGSVLKVILGTGELKSPQVILGAAITACEAGADFVKTSTGKEAVNATPEAFSAMARAVKSYYGHTGRVVGLKVAGGVSTLEKAVEYLEIARREAGPEWGSPTSFRIGASGLLDSLQAAMAGQSVCSATEY